MLVAFVGCYCYVSETPFCIVMEKSTVTGFSGKIRGKCVSHLICMPCWTTFGITSAFFWYRQRMCRSIQWKGGSALGYAIKCKNKRFVHYEHASISKQTTRHSFFSIRTFSDGIQFYLPK